MSIATIEQIILQNVEYARELREDQHTVTLVLQLGKQLLASKRTHAEREAEHESERSARSAPDYYTRIAITRVSAYVCVTL